MNFFKPEQVNAILHGKAKKLRLTLSRMVDLSMFTACRHVDISHILYQVQERLQFGTRIFNVISTVITIAT